MTLIVICALLGLIPAFIAQSKGRSFAAWWLYGVLLFIVALPHSIFASSVVGLGRRKCPHCAEMIREEAKVCRFCGRDVPPPPAPVDPNEGECPYCHQKIDARLHDCPECGKRLKSYWK